MGILKAKLRHNPKQRKCFWIVTENKKNVNVDKFDVNLNKNFRKGDLILMTHDDLLFIQETKSYSAEHAIEVGLSYFPNNIPGPRFRSNIFATLIKP